MNGVICKKKKKAQPLCHWANTGVLVNEKANSLKTIGAYCIVILNGIPYASML